MTTPFVSIIIPTYHDWFRLGLCLAALSEQSYPQDSFEVLVVNNDLSDRQPAGFRLPGNCLVLEEGKPGSYAARNAALRLARGEIIGFTDSDCVPDKNWVKNAVAGLRRDKAASRLAGPVKIFSKHKKPTTVEFYDMIYAFHQKQHVEDGLAVTANMFTYRKVFEEVGYFNDNTMSGGDFEWGRRAHKAGFKIAYSEDVIINHPARDSLKALLNKAKRVGKGEVLTDKRNESLWIIVYELLIVLRPKTWEARFIFSQGKEILLLDKIYLLLLRHLVLWTSDFSRIGTKLRRL